MMRKGASQGLFTEGKERERERERCFEDSYGENVAYFVISQKHTA